MTVAVVVVIVRWVVISLQIILVDQFFSDLRFFGTTELYSNVVVPVSTGNILAGISPHVDIRLCL